MNGNDSKTVADLLAESKRVATGAAEPDMFKQLVQLLLMQNQDAIEEKAHKKMAQKAREKQREKSSGHENITLLTKQSGCSHLKGGKNRDQFNDARIDYIVYTHTYINGETVIKCRTCGMRWKKDDTKEFLVRNNHKIPNHTSIGWREAYMMTRASTDKASKGEVSQEAVIRQYLEGKEKLGQLNNQFGDRVNKEVLDVDGNLAHDVQI